MTDFLTEFSRVASGSGERTVSALADYLRSTVPQEAIQDLYIMGVKIPDRDNNIDDKLDVLFYAMTPETQQAIERSLSGSFS